MKRSILLVLLAVVALGIVGCGSDESREDAGDVQNGLVDKSQPAVVAFNNHFPNVEIKCDGFGDLILAITHDSQKAPAITVIPGHPHCTIPGAGYKEVLESGHQAGYNHPPDPDRADYPPSAAVVP